MIIKSVRLTVGHQTARECTSSNYRTLGTWKYEFNSHTDSTTKIIEGGIMGRFTYYRENEDTEPVLCSVSYAKKQMKAKGGTAWTDHFDRDGSFQESTPITLGNNANTTYGAKYNTSKCYKNE